MKDDPTKPDEGSAPPKDAMTPPSPRSQDEKSERPKEVNGRGGLEPTRYGDWEIKGIASDF